MIAFNIEALLLLALAFLAGLGLGLFIARRRAPVVVPPAAPPQPPAGRLLEERTLAAAMPARPPEPPPADLPRPSGDDRTGMGATRVRPEPEPDLFTRLLASAPPLPPEEEDDLPPPPPPPSPPSRAEPVDHPGERPPTLEAPDGGVADDLKLLKGIGPQNERRLNALGIFHFSQIADWTPQQAAWVGSYLAFPGRIEREDWIGQAQVLAAGGPPPEGAGRRKR